MQETETLNYNFKPVIGVISKFVNIDTKRILTICPLNLFYTAFISDVTLKNTSKHTSNC